MSRAIKDAPEHAEQDAVAAFAVRVAASKINPFVGFIGFKDTADNVRQGLKFIEFSTEQLPGCISEEEAFGLRLILEAMGNALAFEAEGARHE